MKRTYRLKESRRIERPLKEVFDFAADFANTELWDPGIDRSKALDDGPVSVGSRYEVEGSFGPSSIEMSYEVVEYEPPRRVVLSGEAEGFLSTDIMEFEADGEDATLVDYTAEITLNNPLRFLGPLMKIPLQRMGEKALDGLVDTLER